MKWILLFLILCVPSLNVFAEEKRESLTFSYWSVASPPFVMYSNDTKHDVDSGIIKALSEAISHSLNVNYTLVDLPVQRIEPQLQSGDIDVDCITNPLWKKNPELYYWSPPLFNGSDRFLVKKGREHNATKFNDLVGKRLGIYNGYTYHPEIMEMISSEKLEAIKLSDIDHGIELLLLDRIDALIDFDILLNYKLKTKYSASLALADLVAEKYELFCAYSKKMIIDRTRVDDVLEDLVKDGSINMMLEKY